MKQTLLPIVAAVLAAISSAGVHAAPTARTPVIVELFTSEGCSSCPPADALLSRLEKAQPVSGVHVIALGEHVDYWNHGGWSDRFSSPKFSARQNDYAQAFRKDTVYTPQMIVDGRTEFVGSDEDQARAAIAHAARQPKAWVFVTQSGSTLAVRVDHLPVSSAHDPSEVLLAITEDGLNSSVGGGENVGRRLVHSAVVRQLIRLGTVSSGVFTATPSVKAFIGRHGSLNAVVFVQERGSRRILGAAQTDLK